MGAKKNREQRLLLLLTKRHDYITSDELAEYLGTSQKTIYRLIKKINETHGEGLIQSEKGRGYKLNYEKYISQSNECTIKPAQSIFTTGAQESSNGGVIAFLTKCQKCL